MDTVPMSAGGSAQHNPKKRQHCIFEKLKTANIDAASILSIAASCTAASRNQADRTGDAIQTSGCQPLGAWHCAMGFNDCLPRVQGGINCIHYFDQYLNQQGQITEYHRSENTPSVAVNTQGLMKVNFNTCLASEQPSSNCIDASQPNTDQRRQHTANANTPSFVGNQSNGWDNMMAAIICTLPKSDRPVNNHSINLIMGFEHFEGNYRAMEQLLAGFGVNIRLLSDASKVLNSTFCDPINVDGTPLSTLYAAPQSLETLIVRPWQLAKSRTTVQQHWGHAAHYLPVPMGLAWTDLWLQYFQQLSGREIPLATQQQRYLLCDAIHRATPLINKNRVAVCGEPDFVMGISRFLIELGIGPALIVCHNGNKHWQDAMQGLLSDSGYHKEVTVIIGSAETVSDQLLTTHHADLLVAPPSLHSVTVDSSPFFAGAKQVKLDLPTQSEHPATTLGYQGALHILNAIVDTLAQR